ncbi:peroxin 11B [Histoplasma capsulatum G186AR]|uniref:Peroxin 11B n=1 Tax=Ajellomyces capsulatus TaxID=5037 RepID=A0A8H7YX45_AJECA|nr:peroxin 11B [Histoplasma capsulatum]QSS67196.1 peroxin 11B [Histoplasma capsulatum G186AR]
MANRHPQSLLKQFTNYTNSGIGLENVLRVIQSICQVISASVASASEAEPWTKAWINLALSRRYFRYFQFIDCFERAWAILSGQDPASGRGYVVRTMAVGEWSCLGGYLLLEAFTILDALNIHPTQWAEQVLLESYRFWFYSMVFASVRILWQLLVPPSPPEGQEAKLVNVKQEDEKGDSKVGNKKSFAGASDETVAGSNADMNTVHLLTELVILGCDILIPVQALGWLNVDDVTVGSAAVLSTLLMGKDKWVEVQAQVGALSRGQIGC